MSRYDSWLMRGTGGPEDDEDLVPQSCPICGQNLSEEEGVELEGCDQCCDALYAEGEEGTSSTAA